MKILPGIFISFSSDHWNFCSNFGCIDRKHRQLKFLLMSGYMILVDVVSDCLKMKRVISCAAYYVNSRKLN